MSAEREDSVFPNTESQAFVRQCFEFWFFSVVINANVANFQQVCLARASGNFGWS